MLFHLTHCFSVCVPAIAVIQRPHAPVFGIRKYYVRNPQQHTVKLVCVRTTSIFPPRETNATSIASVFTNFVNSEVCLFHQAQTNNSANTIVRTLDEGIPTSVRMCIATASVAVGEETNKNNLHCAVQNTTQNTYHIWCVCVMCVMCVVSLVDKPA